MDKKTDVNFITGIKADRSYGFSVYERNLYEGFKDKVKFNDFIRSGCSMIASNRASIPEVVVNAGILVEPDEYNLFNSMFNLLSNETLRKELSEKGLEQAKKFSLEKECEETLKSYKEILLK